MGFLAVGFALYVVADSGFFHNQFLNKLKVSKDLGGDPLGTSIQEAKSLKSSLDQARNEMDNKKRNLVAIAEQMRSVDESIAKESREVELLQRRLREIESDRGNFEKAIRELAGQKSPAQKMATKYLSVESLSDVVRRVESLGLEVETVEKNGALAFRLANTSALFSEENYLRPVGLRLARTLAAGYSKVSNFAMALNYAQGDEDARERAMVVKRYIKEVLGGQDPVQTYPTSSEGIREGEQMEILISEVGQ